MFPELIEKMRCPVSGQRLRIKSEGGSIGPVDTGYLVSVDGRNCYPIRNGIPRFVSEENYAESFGMQWNLFPDTQLDSCSGHPISANRFWKATGWEPEQLKNAWVLDVGCGAGRFAEIALQAGAKVIAIDCSTAIDVCRQNLSDWDRLYPIQGDIYSLPLELGMFDYVYSIGVSQHTPDVQRAFEALPPMLSSEGYLCVDFYEKSWRTKFLPKYLLRRLTKKMQNETLLRLLKILVPMMLPLSRLVGLVPVYGSLLRRLLPVACYYGDLPLNHRQQREWALLDTFDWLSPDHDNPQTESDVREWIEQAKLKDIEVIRAGHLVTRGRR